jgi:hypothetical protein
MKLIKATKGLSVRIAKSLRISRQAVSDWVEVPINRLEKVEELSGFPRERLRPDIFRRRPPRRK